MGQLAAIADEHKAKKIITVKVSIGRLSGIVADSFAFGFETLASENSLTRNAVLEITVTEPAKRCIDCGFIGETGGKECPRCSSSKLSAEGGDELILTQVEME